MLELADKQPLEDHVEATQNGLKEMEIELEAEGGTEVEAQLIPSAGEPDPESVTPPSNTDILVPVKEDPGQSSHYDVHLTSKDMRRAKRIRVRQILMHVVCGGVV